MGKSIKGTQTEKNLHFAFAGESQARMRYTYFASAAQKEGYEQIAGFFLETAENEKEHGKMFYKHLEGGTVEFDARFPSCWGTTAEHLRSAIEGEHEEQCCLYPGFADVARDEGFPEIENTFRQIAKVEIWHERRYRKLLEALESGTVFKKSEPTSWKCRNCGRVMENIAEAPAKCPSCLHPQAYFELFCENY